MLAVRQSKKRGLMKPGQLDDLINHEAKKNEQNDVEEPEPTRRKQRTHFLGGEIGLGLGRLDPPAKKTCDLGGKGARDLLFRRHRNNKLGHGRDFHHLYFVGKRQTHVVTFHFFFKKAGGPQLVDLELESSKQLLLFGKSARY